MSVNRYDSNSGTLTALASGERTWIGTRAQYDAQKTAGTLPNSCLIVITDDEEQTEAHQISYDNTTSGLAATDVQAAVDELDTTLGAKTDTASATGSAFARIAALRNGLLSPTFLVNQVIKDTTTQYSFNNSYSVYLVYCLSANSHYTTHIYYKAFGRVVFTGNNPTTNQYFCITVDGSTGKFQGQYLNSYEGTYGCRLVMYGLL